MSCRCYPKCPIVDECQRRYCSNCGNYYANWESLVPATMSNDKLRTSRILSQKKAPEPQQGHKWSIYEALNLILACMTKQLIQCSDVAELKPVVFAVWMEALHRFKIPENDDAPENGGMKFMYDRQVAEKKQVRRAPRKPKLVDIPDELLTKSRKILKRSKIKKQLLKEAQSSSAKTKAADNNKTRTSRRARIQQDLQKFMPNASEQVIERLKLSRTCVRDPEYITLPKLICYLYSGLLLCQQLVGLPDIMRWIREELIIFFKAHRILPENMKTSDRDCIMLGSVSKLKLPSCDYLREHTYKILHSLDITEIYLPPAHLLAEKLIRDLQLPSELIDCVRNLEMAACKSIDWRKVSITGKIPNPDACAAGFLLIAVKLLLGLDGVSENNISRFAERVNQILGSKPSSRFNPVPPAADRGHKTQFVWDDWVRYTEYKTLMLTKHHVPTAIRNGGLASVDVDYFKHFCSNRSAVAKARKRPVSEDVSKSIEQVLDEICDIGASVNSENKFPAFKPGLLATHSLVEELIKTDPAKFRLLENRFPDSTFQCIANPEQLACAISQADPSVVLNTCPDCDESGLRIFNMNASFYGSWKSDAVQDNSTNIKVEKPKIKCPAHTSNCHQDGGKEYLHVPSHDYWTFATMYLDRSSTDDWVLVSSKLPGSFLWLLNLVSRNIEEQPKILYYVLSSLESAIMPRHASVLHTWDGRHLKLRYNSAQKTELNRAYFNSN